MTYVTSIGLDVHARSVSTCAFDPFTGEVAQRTFGTDAAEIAGWILGFEEPKAVYGSGPTGFALCRELRAPGVDCVVGAVSRMQRPSAERGRFSRFPTAGSYASWLGLAPSERSSGEKEARGGITKTGNSASRRALVEAARHFHSRSPKPKAAPAGYEVSAAIKGRADDATERLSRRHGALRAAGKRARVANAAVARELACWVRGIGRRAEGTLG